MDLMVHVREEKGIKKGTERQQKKDYRNRTQTNESGLGQCGHGTTGRPGWAKVRR